ncbi:MAG: maleylacetoacetate isomerase [Mizugakiibacter sp.]|uniref:maleylacetoacetate isomerase n=1 Tax=Mizugakiibacter sp. TaxID=1972610 RepID=UPI0031C7555E|nr:maleylacetoacetate isomerase [Xanthomonadaceae bacterium]
MQHGLVLYSYWRSSAAYRVRIALNLKGLPYAIHAVHLVREGGEQHHDGYRALNPQELVPVLKDGERVIRQSLAIVEYLEEAYEGETKLLPIAARDRARVRALAQIVACDIHPLGNLRVLQYLDHEFNAPQVERERWVRHWMAAGFGALEKLLADSPCTGRFCEADSPGYADLCLVPQVYNAQRWGLSLEPYPTIRRIHDACMELEAFRRARPEAQPDAPKPG